LILLWTFISISASFVVVLSGAAMSPSFGAFLVVVLFILAALTPLLSLLILSSVTSVLLPPKKRLSISNGVPDSQFPASAAF
jgi:hypothetical protein